jgi:hypothetical protein
MKLLEVYFELQQKIYDFFGYVEDWVVIPLEDSTNHYWSLQEDGDGGGRVRFAETVEVLRSTDGHFYENEVYTQRFLPKWIYRADGYTMICVDTHTDGNKFLQVFDNSKEIKDLDWDAW